MTYTLEQMREEIIKQEGVVENAKNLLEHMGVLAKEIEEESKVWKPKRGDETYLLYHSGETHPFTFDDLAEFRQGNVFQTREEAEQESERRTIMHELRQLNGGYVCETGTMNFVLELVHYEEGSRINVEFYDSVQNMNQVYFATEEAAQNAIDVIGEEKLRRLF